MNARNWNALKKRISPHVDLVKNKEKDLSKNLEPLPNISIYLLKGTILSFMKHFQQGSFIKDKSFIIDTLEKYPYTLGENGIENTTTSFHKKNINACQDVLSLSLAGRRDSISHERASNSVSTPLQPSIFNESTHYKCMGCFLDPRCTCSAGSIEKETGKLEPEGIPSISACSKGQNHDTENVKNQNKTDPQQERILYSDKILMGKSPMAQNGTRIHGTKKQGQPAVGNTVGMQETFPVSLPASLLQGPILLVSICPTDQSYDVGRDSLFQKKDSERDILFCEGIRVIEKNFFEKPLLLGGFFLGRFFDTGDLSHLFALSPTYPFLQRNLRIQIKSSLNHCGNWLAHPCCSLQNGIHGHLPQFMKILSLFRDEKKSLV
jgi:hypothetical protein